MIETINPATGESLARYPLTAAAALDTVLSQARASQAQWMARPFAARGALLLEYADQLRYNAQGLAKLAAWEMGKPITQGLAEVEKCAALCEHFAAYGARYLSPEAIAGVGSFAEVQFQPLGVIFSITPWNMPFWQILRFAVPALMAGNTVVVKPAPNTAGCALRIAELFTLCGAPEALLAVVLVDIDIAAQIIADDRIDAVALTGSETAGVSVAARAGAALKKVVLELGGSDPFVVLPGADLAAAAKTAAKARFQNAGQVCLAAKRILVESSVFEPFLGLFVDEVRALQIGDPLQPATDLGPMARDDLRRELDRQARDSIDEGAEVRLRGGPMEGPGFFYAPTVLANAASRSAAMREETFGPLAVVNRVQGEAEAIMVANDTRYGLSASVWTGDPEQARRFASGLQVGSVFINCMASTDPRLPFGGVKKSGFGRELAGHGMREFVNIKSVIMT